MGVEVVVGGAGAACRDSIRELVLEWERVFSRFRADSELTRVNASPADALLVSPLFARVVHAALAAARATGGLVDPTLGAALVAAGYDRDFARLAPDSRPPDLASAGRWREVSLTGRLLSRPPGLELDLNGVVKGMVVDEAVQRLPAGSFVAAGGDVATTGPVVTGLPGGGASVRLLSGGLATSGSTRRRWSRAGVAQHHLIDSRTGRPSRSRWDEVTVAASTCVAADVAAKAAFLLSADGPDWLDEHGLAGRFREGATTTCNAPWRQALHESSVAA